MSTDMTDFTRVALSWLESSYSSSSHKLLILLLTITFEFLLNKRAILDSAASAPGLVLLVSISLEYFLLVA